MTDLAEGDLVQDGVRRHGRLASRPRRANPLDEFSGLARALRRLRLKEWVGFTLVHPDCWSSLIVQDAHYLASSEIYAHDRSTGTLYQHAANAHGGSPALPDDLLDGGHCAFERPGYAIMYDFSRADGRHVLRFDVAATERAPAFRGELALDATRSSPPLSVSSRLPGGQMYTHKAIFPAEGVVRFGEREIRFDGSRGLAILDEHRSFLPYRTRWLWGTFALRAADGVLIGANFADRPEVPGEPEESGIWSPEGCEPLADVVFEPRSPGEAMSPWHIASRDGRLEVDFEPEGRKAVRHQLGLFAIDYFQLYGRYRGRLAAGGRVHEIEGAHGVCESMRARL